MLLSQYWFRIAWSLPNDFLKIPFYVSDHPSGIIFLLLTHWYYLMYRLLLVLLETFLIIFIVSFSFAFFFIPFLIFIHFFNSIVSVSTVFGATVAHCLCFRWLWKLNLSLTDVTLLVWRTPGWWIALPGWLWFPPSALGPDNWSTIEITLSSWDFFNNTQSGVLIFKLCEGLMPDCQYL